MKGPIPKSASTRQRRNRVATQAVLPSVTESAERDVPKLPAREGGVWHPKVMEWWESVWKSPMAAEYLQSDVYGGLYLLAYLVHDFWKAEAADARQKAFVGILKGWERFGLSPIDRRRLQWEVEKGDQATDRTDTRRQRKQASSKDPRDALKVV